MPTLHVLRSQMFVFSKLFVMPKKELLWPDFSNKIPLKIHLKFIHPLSDTAFPMLSHGAWGGGWQSYVPLGQRQDTRLADMYR